MNKIIPIIIFALVTTFCNAQTAEDLNKRANEFIEKGDIKNAVPLIKKAAELGNAEAQYNYGYCFQEGFEVDKNDSIANIWLLKSANQGWINAQFKIAYSYATGRGIEKNKDEAFFWSLKCAQQHDPECMFNVISCYLEGIGTPKNLDSMLVWAIRLGSIPNPENLQLSGKVTSARANLAIMYREGRNVKKDLIKSYMWFLIYNESKQDFSITVQQQQIDIIKDLEKYISLEDKNQAKIAAEKQIGKKLINLDNLYKTDL